jgi:hypothetical protein
MPIETYYTSKSKEGKFGEVFFLKQLQESDSSGGGSNLLGSMVQWIDTLVHQDYAIPLCMSGPRALIKELEKRKDSLEISGDVTLQIKVGVSSETVKLEKKASFDIGVGPFPIIPLNMSLDVDYSRMKSITVKFGAGTYSEYIPVGYLANLYAAVTGKPPASIGGELLKKNAFVNQIVLANKYSVTFESTDSFSTGVETKLKTYNSLPEINGKVKVEKKTERTLTAEVDSPIYYVVALTTSRWDRLK